MTYFNNTCRRKFLKLLIFILFQQIRLFPQVTQLNLKKEFPVINTGNDIWIGTPGGLYQYKNDDDSYKFFAIPGKETSNIKYLYYSNEWLWCVLDSGLAALQTRLNQWMVFDEKKDLPSNKINALAFQGDYVWVATDNGAARFDLLIEEWEIYDKTKGIPDTNLVKILIQGDLIWFVTNNGFSEYNFHFEKWRHFTVPDKEQIKISDAFEFGNNFWFVTNKGLIKFNPELNSQEYFFNENINSEKIVDLVYENDIIWILGQNKLYYIQSESQVLKEFEGNYFLKDYSFKNFNLDSYEIWLSTGKNVLDWNRTYKTWKIIDYASGVSDSSYSNIYVNGGMTFLINDHLIDYKLNTESPWKNYNLIKTKAPNSAIGKKILKNLFNNDEGGFIDIGKNKLKFDGTRATYIYNKGADGKIKSGERLDVKNQLNLGKKYSIYGFYNNIDYSETMYGLRFKSNLPKNIIREINLGDFRREPGTIPFGENVSIFGGNVWLQAGAKTERFKRSKYSFKAITGQLRSKKEFEYYQGAINKFDEKINDNQYSKALFYTIPNLPENEIPDKIELYLDNKNSSDNTKNTLQNNTIAGIKGDFDLLVETEDYYYHSKFKAIKMNITILPGYSLVIRYQIKDQEYEKILQADGISSARQNIYFLNGNSIIPNSFKLEISDNLNNIQNLNKFGIDEDNDGIVDPEWIDYENGYLTFADSKPFPFAVYDSASQSFCQLNVNYETKRSIIKLKYKDLVRGTEIVKLDGIISSQGSDYVLDYTNGTLVFVKEGVVNIDTRIEIEYEHYLQSQNNRINSAYLNFSPSDNFYIQADWLNFNNSQKKSSDSASNQLSIHSELRHKIGQRMDIKLISGIVYQAESNKFSGGYLEGLVSTSKFRFQTKYYRFDSSYNNLYNQQNILGKIKNKLQLNSSADLLRYLKLTGEWNNEESFNNNSGKKLTNQIGNYSLLLHKINLPSWQISFQKINTKSDYTNINKYSIINQLEFQVPENFMKYLIINSIKAQAYFRQGVQSGLNMLGTGEQRFNQKYVRLNTNFTDQISGSFFYRRNDYYDNKSKSDKNFLTRNERVLINFSQEQWRLLQMNVSIENTLDQNHLIDSKLNSAKINKYTQINFRFSPGQLWSKLNPLFFEFNMNQSVTSWGAKENSIENYIWQLYDNGKELLDYSQKNTGYYIKNEFRPTSKILLYSLVEWNHQVIKSDASNLALTYRRWNEKLEVKPGYKFRVILQYKQFFQNNSYQRIFKYYEPSAWIEHRWNNSLQDIVNIQYRISPNQENKIESQTNNFIISYNIIWIKEKFLGLKRFEIRNDISENITQTGGDKNEKLYLLTNNTSFDIYPFSSMILRFQFQYKNNYDFFISKNSYSNIAYNFKFILRF